MRRIYRRRFTKLKLWVTGLMLLAATVLALRMRHVGAMPDGADLILLRAASWAPAALLALGLIWFVWRHWGAVGFFDVDVKARRFRLWLWRPIGWRRIEGDLQVISGWHYETGRPPAIRATLTDPLLELAFLLRPGVRLDRDWQRIAPGAVAAYERDDAAVV